MDDGTDYWWNYTGNEELTDYTGVWKNEDGDGDNDEIYDRFWSSVWAVGDFEGEKWFGFYFCGPAVTYTKMGIPWVVKEGSSYTDAFKVRRQRCHLIGAPHRLADSPTRPLIDSSTYRLTIPSLHHCTAAPPHCRHSGSRQKPLHGFWFPR